MHINEYYAGKRKQAASEKCLNAPFEIRYSQAYRDIVWNENRQRLPVLCVPLTQMHSATEPPQSEQQPSDEAQTAKVLMVNE